MSGQITREINFYFRRGGTRQQLRRHVVEKFLREEPGLGGGRLASKYRYNVERLGDGRKIYLLRPAYNYKGFDFVINVEQTRFLNGRENPKHDDVLLDLRSKRQQDPRRYGHLHEAMARVYDCQDPTHVLPEHPGITFPTGYSAELILKLLKWLWIEQDIRDWNYSGRLMLWRAIEAIRD